MKKEDIIKYPHLDHSRQLYPSPRIILGKLLIWSEKRDGSNVRVVLDENGDIQFGSRNMFPASPDLINSMHRTGYISTLEECLKEHRDTWNSNLIIFFELLQKGKSPTRTEFHEKDDITIFDIFSLESGWLNYTKIHQICYEWKFPIVELWGMSVHSNLKTFKKFKGNMLKLAKKKNREGVVAKYYHQEESIFFKERLDVPVLDKVKIHIDKDAVESPFLPDIEVLSEVEKARVDLGMENFRKKEIAMPDIVRRVKEEARRRLCRVPKNLYSYYLQRIEDFENET